MVTYSDLYDRLIRGEEKLALVGLGYVGMPIAVEFACFLQDLNVQRGVRTKSWTK